LLVVLLGGLLATSTASLVSGAGAVLVVAGVVLLAIAAPAALRYALLLLAFLAVAAVAAAGWIDPVGDRVFDWLEKDAAPWFRAHPVAWLVFVVVLVLPPVWWAVGLTGKLGRALLWVWHKIPGVPG
jgi:hypothetical protein